jgi:hypothetical protein
MVSDFLLVLRRVISIQYVVDRLKGAEKFGSECTLNLLSVGIRVCGGAHGVIRRVGQGVTQQAGEREATPRFPPGAPQYYPMALIRL